MGQLSRQITAQPSSTGGFIDNTVDIPNNESCHVIELKDILVSTVRDPRLREKQRDKKVRKHVKILEKNTYLVN